MHLNHHIRSCNRGGNAFRINKVLPWVEKRTIQYANIFFKSLSHHRSSYSPSSNGNLVLAHTDKSTGSGITALAHSIRKSRGQRATSINNNVVHKWLTSRWNCRRGLCERTEITIIQLWHRGSKNLADWYPLNKCILLFSHRCDMQFFPLYKCVSQNVILWTFLLVKTQWYATSCNVYKLYIAKP